MIVLKFGGTSVSTKQSVQTICAIVKKQKEMAPIVVVSAMKGITDILLSLTRYSQTNLLEKIEAAHKRLIAELWPNKNDQIVHVSYVEHTIRKIAHLVQISKKITPEHRDTIASYGEIMSSYIITQFLLKNGVRARQIIASNIIITNDSFGNAEYYPGATKRKTVALLHPLIAHGVVPVITGFIGATRKGKITTLGRGGSDYSASIIGSCVGAKEIQIWTDVSGIFSSDPNVVKDATVINEMSYELAGVFANGGAKVLHPKAIGPAIRTNIPIRILNTFRPTDQGTIIMHKVPVAILGATGSVGQRFIQLLERHPWFEIVCLAASSKSSGKSYQESVRGRWSMETSIPKQIQHLPVYEVEKDFKYIATIASVAFCALDMDKNAIKKIEERYASSGVAVISNNSAHRFTPDVPMIIPEINPEHARLIDIQRKNRGWKNGLIAVKPNCSIQSYVSILTALKKFKPAAVRVVSLQAISGAGKTFDTWPEMVDNAIPYIDGEEEKSEKEPLKIWGEIKSHELVFAKKPTISATCIRIPTSNGHMASVSVSFGVPVTKEQIVSEVTMFNNPIDALQLPSSPKKFITYCNKNDRPQITVDRNLEKGMGIAMGRLQKGKLFDWKFIALSHNTIRGAAGGAILMAELLVKKGYIKT